ncbi:DUF3348 family protein [Pseudorhodoferax sp.]|uniref:DUF3348 family protein n=1 Tax=Pseudorhodoferax sp. TaxID=1993553 RepID=UPI002DD62C83|nr:DUF3348 family protein [Pseudorhodoferax sp.]
MLHGSPRPGLAGSELTRLLARLAHLADTPPAAAPAAFAERLGHWLNWTGAITLSGVLDTASPVPAGPAATAVAAAGRAQADVQRVQAALLAAIAAGPDEPASSPADFGPHRRHCLALQQAMQDTIGALRQRLRDALLRQSPAQARLAAIDRVLDQALATQERGLLGLVPLRLQAHFERLQRSAPEGDQRWPAVFRADMACLLQAELAHRLLPAQGLLAALRPSS